MTAARINVFCGAIVAFHVEAQSPRGVETDSRGDLMNRRGVAVLFLLTLLTALVALYFDTRFDARLAQEHTVAITAER